MIRCSLIVIKLRFGDEFEIFVILAGEKANSVQYAYFVLIRLGFDVLVHNIAY